MKNDSNWQDWFNSPPATEDFMESRGQPAPETPETEE